MLKNEMCWKVHCNVASNCLTGKKTKISRFLSKFYVFCLPEKCKAYAGEENKINIRNKICRDTEETVHFFLIAWNVCVCSYFDSVFPSDSVVFLCVFSSSHFSLPLLCCLLFWAHVHKWLLLPSYWFNTECAVEVKKRVLLFVCMLLHIVGGF